MKLVAIVFPAPSKNRHRRHVSSLLFIRPGTDKLNLLHLAVIWNDLLVEGIFHAWSCNVFFTKEKNLLEFRNSPTPNEASHPWHLHTQSTSCHCHHDGIFRIYGKCQCFFSFCVSHQNSIRSLSPIAFCIMLLDRTR